MCNRLILLALPWLLLSLLADPAWAQRQESPKQSQKLYRWVDKSGQVHYGDKVPPEYADQDRDILDKSGLKVGHEPGAETPERTRQREAQERAAAQAEERARRDRMLLQTYQDPEEIGLLRARRIDQIDAQLTIQEQSLATLKARRDQQLAQARRYAPRSTKPDAPPLPEGLAADLEQSESDIRVQEENLQRKREERAAVNRKFDEDLKRFNELRRIE